MSFGSRSIDRDSNSPATLFAGGQAAAFERWPVSGDYRWWLGVLRLNMIAARKPGRELIMIFVSLTRLRVRSTRFVPIFALYTFRALRQVKKTPGFQKGRLLADRSRTFWTMTAWDTQENMRQFMTTGAHKKAMPRLLHWCDEASVAHWTQPEATLPSWTDADKRMREIGRPSKVLYPSPQHASLTYRAPRTTATGEIRRS
jgi:heme-degrading monooxygenase HmoA